MAKVIVVKFGGTSVGSAECMAKLPHIISPLTKRYHTIVVVSSAMSKVTDMLIKSGEAAAARNTAFKSIVSEIRSKHTNAAHRLLPKNKIVLNTIEELIISLEQILQGVYLTGEFTPRTRDLVMSFGERLSCSLLYMYFNSQKLKSEFCDARQIIQTNAQFGEAIVNFTTTNKLVKNYYEKHKGIIITTGFIAGTKDGITTTLGRGGSDYTAAIIGAALSAEEIQI